MFLQPRPLSLSAFSDSKWAGDPFDRRSITGYMVYLGYNPITWSAKKQEIVSMSSIEAEYRDLATIVVELSWLCQVLKDLGIFLPSPPPPPSFGEIMFLPLLLSQILFFMLAPSMWRFIITLFLKRCFAKIFMRNTFPLVINLLIFSPRACLHLVLFFSSPKSWCLLTLWF